jgi:hypothetical protein
MSNETRPTPAVETPAAAAPSTPAVPAVAARREPLPTPEKWKPLFRELTTYYRHLPELLAEEEANRYVVVKGDELFNTWDTFRDAIQYGYERFGEQLFMVHKVDPRDLDRLAPYFPAPEAACPD